MPVDPDKAVPGENGPDDRSAEGGSREPATAECEHDRTRMCGLRHQVSSDTAWLSVRAGKHPGQRSKPILARTSCMVSSARAAASSRLRSMILSSS